MIFLSAGTQLPFARLVHATIDQMVLDESTEEIVCQTAMVNEPHVAYSGATYRDFFSSEDFMANFIEADLVVSHAGMGNILACLEHNKLGVFLARSYELGEHRNDHQMDTVNVFQGKFPKIHLYQNESDFRAKLSEILEFELKSQHSTGASSSFNVSDDMLNFKTNLEKFMKQD
jgi:UDP-N-acetylglucosamine transferase subunit ALG13